MASAQISKHLKYELAPSPHRTFGSSSLRHVLVFGTSVIKSIVLTTYKPMSKRLQNMELYS